MFLHYFYMELFNCIQNNVIFERCLKRLFTCSGLYFSSWSPRSNALIFSFNLQLEDNCLTVLFWFLLNSNVNQSQGHINLPPSSLPPTPTASAYGEPTVTQGPLSLHGSQHCPGKGACVTQCSSQPCHVGPSKTEGSHGESWRSLVHWSRERPTAPVFLLWKLHAQYEKAKK